MTDRIADWPLTTVRTFLLAPVNGSDANQGYSDVAGPYDPTTQAMATLDGLRTVFPVKFAGRKFRLIYAAGSYSSLLSDILNGVDGFGTSVVKATSTNPTAGSVAFQDDTADRTYVGMTTATGANAPGYNPIGTPTTTLVQLQLNGGGTASFAAEPGAPLMYRIRFAVDTATVALRNVCRTVIQISGDTVLLDTALPAVPATSDVAYIEMAATAWPGTVISVGPSGGQLQIVSARFPTGGLVVQGGNVTLVSCGGASLRALNGDTFFLSAAYTDPVAAANFTTGGTFRSETTMSVSGYRGSVALASPLVGSGRCDLLGNSQQTTFSNGPVFTSTVNINNYPSAVNTLLSSGAKARTIGPAPTDGVILNHGALLLPPWDFTNLGNASALQPRENCYLGLGSGVTGSTGNNHYGLELTNAQNCTIVLFGKPSVTGALGDVHVNNGILTWDEVFATGFIDAQNNRIIPQLASQAGGPTVPVKSFSGALTTSPDNPSFTYAADVGSAQAANIVDPIRYPMVARIITRMRACGSAGIGPQPVTLTVYKNGVATDMTCTLHQDTSAGVTAVDDLHQVIFNDLDTVDVRADVHAIFGDPIPFSVVLEGPT